MRPHRSFVAPVLLILIGVVYIVAAIIGAPFLSKNRDSRYTTTNEQ